MVTTGFRRIKVLTSSRVKYEGTIIKVGMKNLGGLLVVDYHPETVKNHKPSKNSL
jgi:hypothetical protein